MESETINKVIRELTYKNYFNEKITREEFSGARTDQALVSLFKDDAIKRLIGEIVLDMLCESDEAILLQEIKQIYSHLHDEREWENE